MILRERLKENFYHAYLFDFEDYWSLCWFSEKPEHRSMIYWVQRYDLGLLRQINERQITFLVLELKIISFVLHFKEDTSNTKDITSRSVRRSKGFFIISKDFRSDISRGKWMVFRTLWDIIARNQSKINEFCIPFIAY